MQTFKQYLLEESEPVSIYQQWITPEMENHFIARTKTHIDYVNEYGLKLLKYFPLNDSRKFKFLDILTNHDKSKYSEPERSLYVLISWKYHLEEDEFKKLNLPDWLLEEMSKISEIHVKNNKHHPEAWDSSLISGFVDEKDRDEREKIIDGTQMPDLYIAEMICDWCSVSKELNNSPKDWADKNINKKWKFTPKQVELIYKLIDILWEESPIEEAIRYAYCVETKNHFFKLSEGIRCSRKFPSKVLVQKIDNKWKIDHNGRDLSDLIVSVENK